MKAIKIFFHVRVWIWRRNNIASGGFGEAAQLVRASSARYMMKPSGGCIAMSRHHDARIQ